jgi:hypothetical protein
MGTLGRGGTRPLPISFGKNPPPIHKLYHPHWQAHGATRLISRTKVRDRQRGIASLVTANKLTSVAFYLCLTLPLPVRDLHIKWEKEGMSCCGGYSQVQKAAHHRELWIGGSGRVASVTTIAFLFPPPPGLKGWVVARCGLHLPCKAWPKCASDSSCTDQPAWERRSACPGCC